MEKNNPTHTDNEHDIIIAHPSYEVNQTFMSLGFRETVISNNQPEDKNFYIKSGKDISIHKEHLFKYEDKTIIFHEQDRILLRVNDRWDKNKIVNFITNKEPPKELYQEIKQTMKNYIEFQREAIYGIITAWIIATYFHRCFHAFPFLFIYGKKQSGKSRFLDLLERLSFNAMKVKGVSVAALADSIDGIRGTFLNDQAEELSNKKNTEILGILSDSYTIGGGKRRIVNMSNKSRRIMEFETFGPKAFASIKELDSDLKDRCIEITMLRAIKEYSYPDAYLTIWGDLRDKLYRLLLTRWHAVKEIYQDTGKDVSHRVKELWRPLETILRLEDVPDEETKEIKGFFLESMQETQNELSEYEIELFETLKEMVKDKGKETLTVTDIAERLKSDYATMEEKEKKRFHIWVGKILKQLSLYDKSAGRKDGKRAYEFSYDRIENIYQRYKINNNTMTIDDHCSSSAMVSHKSMPDNDPDHATIEMADLAEDTGIPEKEIEI
ncbi:MULTISPECIES: DUF3631 domain-containing protein [Candidatus Brocadia]|uniref:DUF3631 domain-containing protein n=1 Tax=Candidatus Brocadia sinica JPN1 TaxID=1197129 RepID=A0ABQ0JZP2_9BACT|nr:MULTISPECIES: DUF3631 domain-containing protein [Brocadia]GAN33974.1 hypothetical protein BROSI_A2509 [Candidatus Brocadia sinica JPN1]GIK14243.1 MAG: hypothetical protein BroJett002_29500 [Candidatus Brocadia sinica]GJQ18250.1 MAG: hypothetical protein HBSIN01_22090 [Candidatus Brocadia sinica]